MRRRIALTAIAALALASVPAVAVAGKGGNGGGKGGSGKEADAATIWFEGGDGSYQAGDQVWFGANEPSNKSYWVANLCRQNGEVVSEQYMPVSEGIAGPFSLSGNTGIPWQAGSGAECTAYAWAYPNLYDPLAGASMDYSISG